MNNDSINRDISIRMPTAADAGTLADIYNHYVINTHITFDIDPVSVENRLEWMAGYNNSNRYRLLIAESNGIVLGYASSSRFRVKPAYDNSVETTIYLDPGAAGSGLGALLYGALLESLAAAGVHRCYGVIALPNPASIRLHSRFGFTEAGRLTEVGYKFDQYWDTLWMEKRLG